MRALIIDSPHSARVQRVPAPVPGPGEVVIDVRQVGICGTDVELFPRELPYFEQGKSSFPLSPGHEWCGTVSALDRQREALARSFGASRYWTGGRPPGQAYDAVIDCTGDETVPALALRSVEPGGRRRRASRRPSSTTPTPGSTRGRWPRSRWGSRKRRRPWRGGSTRARAPRSTSTRAASRPVTGR
jgi:threonine dehydrogenase-like Zn-dependent dehydrogenase